MNNISAKLYTPNDLKQHKNSMLEGTKIQNCPHCGEPPIVTSKGKVIRHNCKDLSFFTGGKSAVQTWNKVVEAIKQAEGKV